MKLSRFRSTPSPTSPLPRTPGWIDNAAWLSEDILLAIGWCLARDTDTIRASCNGGDGPVSLDASWTSYGRADFADPGYPAGKVMTIRFPERFPVRPLRGDIVIESGPSKFLVPAALLADAKTDPASAARSALWWLEPAEREGIVRFLSDTLKASSGADAHQLARNLHAIREALREPLPRHTTAADKRQTVNADALLRVHEHGYYVKGWVCDAGAAPGRLTAVSPEGSRVELLDRAFRHSRPDVERLCGTAEGKTGFIAYFELEQPSYLREGWIFECRSADGLPCEAPGPPVVWERAAVRTAILEDLDLEHAWRGQLLEDHTFPAVSRIQELHGTEARIRTVIEYGTPEKQADLSIIIPLYRRLEFLEHQMAQFVHDPGIRCAELIYVLDSPELADDLNEYARDLYQLYRVPFRVAFLEHNSGFAMVNNLGVSIASGRLLLLMNSDVLPDSLGWTSRMVEFYDSKPRIGALGPKLLFEDNTLQHAGLYFHRPDGSSLWENQHYYKGFDRGLPAASVSRPVPAVTAACLMIDRELYRQQGGFRGIYVQGDYEDSDLCLRLLDAGYENWYSAEIELYHLEAQSYRWDMRRLATRYNCWLHTRVWGDAIASVMARFGG
jgi:O-antigen biosynthesis protein